MILPFECPRESNDCGRLHTGCTGHNRAGAPCGAQVLKATGAKGPPEGGNPRCRNHLGRKVSIVQAEYEAERRAAVQFREAEAAARRLGIDWRQMNPLDELLKVAAESVRWMNVCRMAIADLDELRYRSAAGEQQRAEVALWERSMDRAARINADIVRLGIESRLARVTEEQASALLRILDGSLAELGINPHDPAVAAVVHRRMNAEAERRPMELTP